jgi:trigger factor
VETIAVKSAVENLEPTRVKLSVEVPYDELKPSVDAAYKAIAEQVTIPGFRKGKVPPRIIDQRVGRAAVIEHAVNDALPGLYRRAVEEAEIRPLGQPDVEVTAVPDVSAAGGELAFTAEVDVRPEIALPDLATLTVAVGGVEVTDEDVEERLTTLRERFGTLTGVDRPAQDGDFVVIDLTASIDDEEIDSVSGISYQIGSGTMLEGLDEALVGLSAGESATFSSALAGGEHQGEDALITVTPTAVKRRDLPEPDDDFAELASEFDTVQELREDLRRQVADGKRAAQLGQARDALVAVLLDAVDFPVPHGVVEAEIASHLEGEGRLEDDEHREEVRAEATQTLRQQLLLDALVEELGVSVAQDELIQFLLQTSRRFDMDPSEFIANADRAGQIPFYVAELGRSKAVAVALGRVNVVDDAGQAVDLGALLGPQEAAQDQAEGEAAGTAQEVAAEEPTAPEPGPAAKG